MLGKSMTAIRVEAKRRYRDDYRLFGEHCRRKWAFGRTHANRLIEAAAVAGVLTPIGVKVRLPETGLS